jgi:hypothetical protein
LRLAPGVTHEPGLKIVSFDPTAHHEPENGHRVIDLWGSQTDLAGPEVLAALALTGYGTTMNGSDMPVMNLPGYQVLTWVKDALDKRFPLTTVQIRRPAVQVLFGGGYETWEVIPGFLTGRGGSALGYDIPSPVTGGGWIDAAPKEHLAYVNECNKKPDEGDAKALARLVKAWKYYCDVPVSSFYLEMRAAQHVKGLSAYIHVWDICLLLEKLRDHNLADMNDPRGASGRFSATSSDSTRQDALSKLRTAATRARKALDAHQADDPDTAFYYLDLLFGGQFPAR